MMTMWFVEDGGVIVYMGIDAGAARAIFRARQAVLKDEYKILVRLFSGTQGA
jgi:hypothetical protein